VVQMEKAGDGKAKCKLCSCLLACTGSSTSGLKYHLELLRFFTNVTCVVFLMLVRNTNL